MRKTFKICAKCGRVFDGKLSACPVCRKDGSP